MKSLRSINEKFKSINKKFKSMNEKFKNMNENQDEPLGLYFQSLCRRINFRYIKTVQHFGIDSYRYTF